MQTGHSTIEQPPKQPENGLLYKAAVIIGTGLFCACFVWGVTA